MAHFNLQEVLEEEGTWDTLHPPVRGAIEALDLYIPDDPEEAEAEVYERAKRGHCMTCDSPLGDLTMLAMNQAGIVMVFCCGQCYTDMQVTGWLEEKYEDLVTTIKFRGGKFDADGETPDDK